MECLLRNWFCHKLIIKIISVGFIVLMSLNHGDTNTLYVSKAHGSDTTGGRNTCQNKTTPCRTLNYVIEHAASSDVIMVDSTNTLLQPYNNCSSGIFSGTLRFQSWKGYAVVNCSGSGLLFSGDGNVSRISFQGLRLIDTFIQVIDVSLVIINCTFSSSIFNATYLYILNVSVKSLPTSAHVFVNVTNSDFQESNTAGCLLLTNFLNARVFLELNNISISSNHLLKVASFISIAGLVSFSFLNSVVSNNVFPKYAARPSVVRFDPPISMTTVSVSADSKMIKPTNVTLVNHDNLQGKSPVSVCLMGNIFRGNKAKVLFATFNSSARVVILNTSFSENIDTESPGGLIVLNSGGNGQSFEVYFKDCWFGSNRKLSYTPLVWFKISGPVVSNISLVNFRFSNNTNTMEFDYRGNEAMTLIEAPALTLNVLNGKFDFNEGGAVRVITSVCSVLHFSNLHVDSCTFWNDVCEQYGAMVSVVINNFSSLVREWNDTTSTFGLMIEDSEFLDNRAKQTGTGAIFVGSLDIGEEVSTNYWNVCIRRSVFIRNLAHSGTGGIELTSQFHCDISDSIFRENAGEKAGAIYFSGGNIKLRNCSLVSNYGGYRSSTLASGSLRLNQQGNALIQDSIINQTNINQSYGKFLNFHGGVSLSSNQFGSINIANSLFNFLWEPSIERTIVMEISNVKNFILSHGTVIRCPMGYNIKKQTHLEMMSPHRVSFECDLCSMDSYTVDHGTYTEPDQTHHAQCLPCPFGAKCIKGIQALPNFWGYKVNNGNTSMISFSQCPIGYCCQPERHKKSCYPYWTCNSQRHGILCGECKPGFSETLLTPFCRKSEKCNDFWFWPVAVVFVLGFSLYLIVQPDFVSILCRWVAWFSRSAPQAPDPGDKVFDPGYERIVFFYYQATDVLLVQSSYDVWDKYLSQFILGLFNFEIRVSKEGFACPFPGLNPVSKVFFHSLGVFSVLFAIPFIFCAHCFLCFCLKKESPKTGSYLAAFLKGVILGYAVLTEKTIKLLKCVTVNGVSCLFLNCNIRCYTWWQTLIGTLVVIYLFPFVLVLFFGSYKLYHKRVSVLHFLLACFCPLPFLSYWFINKQKLRTRYVPDSEGRSAITSLLIGSYRVPDHTSRGAIYWESVFIGRMLILILCNVLIKEPFLRSLTLLFICVINLSIHMSVLPFELVSANRAETVSQFCLVLMAMFNLPFMGYYSEGIVPSGPVSHVLSIFSWCQVVLVGFLPCVFVLLALSALVSQLARLMGFIVKHLRCFCCQVTCCCHYLERREELVDPLVSSEGMS